MPRDTKRHRKYHKNEPKGERFRKGQQPPEIDADIEMDRFSVFCPACKVGHNCKGRGGSIGCFHCGNCGFVECKFADPEYEWDKSNTKQTNERCGCKYCKDHTTGCNCDTCVALDQ